MAANKSKKAKAPVQTSATDPVTNTQPADPVAAPAKSEATDATTQPSTDTPTARPDEDKGPETGAGGNGSEAPQPDQEGSGGPGEEKEPETGDIEDDAGEPDDGHIELADELDDDDDEIVTLENEGEVHNLPVGTRFYAAFLHNPKSDDRKYYEDQKDNLISGRTIRRSLPTQYWEHHAATHPPLCVRTERNYSLVPYND